MIDLFQVEKLLKESARQLDEMKAETLNNGEAFNLFTILKLERKENKTHSGFICELLNPRGSHHKGTLFLKLFLETIHSDHLDMDSVSTKPEYHIGARNDETKSGGRIDIYLWDKNNKSISIENKIDAYDQNFQIERYVNHQPHINKVFYLNLFGANPSVSSAGQLVAGKDFFIISYKNEILAWLEKCCNSVSDLPIIRENIRQYLLLIKKLTYSMDKKHETSLLKTMLENNEAASFVAINYFTYKANFNESIRNEVYNQVSRQLGSLYNVERGQAATKEYAQIWIKLKEKGNLPLYFGLENFSIHSTENTGIYVGIYSPEGAAKKYNINAEYENWPFYTDCLSFDGQLVNLSHSEFLKFILSNEGVKERFISYLVDETVTYIRSETPHLLTYLSSANNA